MPFTVLDPAAAEEAPATEAGAPLADYGKTLALLREELRLALGGRPDVDTARLDGWINDAYMELCASLQLDEMKASVEYALVPDQHLYELPEAVDTLLSVAIVLPQRMSWHGGYPLDKIDLQVYREFPLDVGAPRSYLRLGQTLVVYPTPSEDWSLVVDFRVAPLPLVDDTDSPVLGRPWHEVIRLAATAKAFADLLEPEKSLLAENRFIEAVRRRRDREADEDENRVVGSSFPSKVRHLRNRVVRPYGIEDL